MNRKVYLKALCLLAPISLYSSQALSHGDNCTAHVHPGGFQHVATYDGTSGVTREFVEIHEKSVVRLSDPRFIGNCTGIYLEGNRILTNSHCVPADMSNFFADFNFQLDSSGNEENPLQRYRVTRLLEREVADHIDYAIFEVDASAADIHPVARLRRTAPPQSTSMVLTAINHSEGIHKRVETGNFLKYTNGLYYTTGLDMHGGGSGGPLLDSTGNVISLTSGAECGSGPLVVYGVSVETLRGLSPAIQGILAGYNAEISNGYRHGFEAGIRWTNTGDFKWEWSQFGTPSSGTGPSEGAKSLTYVYLETSEKKTDGTAGAYKAGDQAELVSHTFWVTPGKAALGFDYHMYGENMGRLAVDVFHNGQWINNVWSRVGQQHSSSTSQWSSAIVDLSAYNRSNVRVRFRAVAAGGWKGDMAIDNIELGDPFLFDTHFRARNFWANEWHLNIQNGPLVATNIQSSWHSAQWAFQKAGDYYRIFNRSNPSQFLHVDHTTRLPTTGPVESGWHSAQWKMIPVTSADVPASLKGKVFRLENRWIQSTGEPLRYLNILQNGSLEVKSIPAESWTSWWIVEDLNIVD